MSGAISYLPKASTITRIHRSLALAGDGGLVHAAKIAESEYGYNSPPAVVLRAASAAGSLLPDDSWGADALSNLKTGTMEFWGLVREQSIVGRIASLKRVPENSRLAGIIGGVSAGWVGQGDPKPFSEMILSGETLPPRKILAQVAVSEELVRMGGLEAEALLRAEEVRSVTEFLDTAFIDPAYAEVTDVSPASITNGVTAITSTDDPAADLALLISSFAGNLETAYLVAHPLTAAQLALARDSGGGYMFGDAGPRGGSVLGIPLLTSRGVPGGTTDGGILVLVDGSGIAFAGGSVVLETARHATVQMDSAPDDPTSASTVMINLWHHNLAALRAELATNWAVLRAGAVAYVSGANYTGAV